MPKNIRQTQGQNVYDPSTIDALQFNPAAGSKKVSEVGRALLPLKYVNSGTVTYTTDASTARRLDFAGQCLAVYNNANAVGSITLGSGNSAPTSLGVGATDANGNVGIPCAPNAWTYIACNNKNWVISSAATLLVFLIDDETNIKQEAAF
jgi:hypothetical protein